MDPTALSLAVIAALKPVLGRITGKVVTALEDKATEAALPALRRLYDAVRARLGREPDGAAAGVALDSEPEAAQPQLEAALRDDPEFAKQVEGMLAEIRNVRMEVQATETGIVAGGDVHMTGTYVSGRDMHIGRDNG